MSQNESTWNVEASNERLCTYFYVDSTISSILQAQYKAEIRKTISKHYAYKKSCKILSTSSTRTNILIWKYFNEQIFWNGST